MATELNRFHERAIEAFEVGAEAHDHGEKWPARYFWYEHKLWNFIGNLAARYARS